MAKKGKKKATPKPSTSAAPPSRMALHVPKLETVFFVLALVGLLVTAHMNFWWQHYQNVPAAAQSEVTCGLPGLGGGGESAFDCAGAFESGAGTLFGVPNAVWGLLFYLAIAGLTAAIVFGGAGDRRTLLKKIRAGMIAFGLVYTLGLTFYQFVVLPKTCLLCLLSALIVVGLFVTLVLYLRTEPTREKPTAPSFALYGGLAVVALLLVGADFGYFSTQEVPDVAEATPMTEASDFDGAAVCRYFEGAPYYDNYRMLVAETDASTGPADAPVTIIEYFDPNCPHCKTAYPSLKATAARFPETVRIVYKPIAVMGAQSNAQVAALLAAAEAGNEAFFTMLDEQFENQKPRSGNTMDELRKFARRAGFDDSRMAERIRDGEFRTRMTRDIRIFQELGFTGVPTIVVNGRRIATRSAQCLGYFVEQALAETTTPAAADTTSG